MPPGTHRKQHWTGPDLDGTTARCTQAARHLPELNTTGLPLGLLHQARRRPLMGGVNAGGSLKSCHFHCCLAGTPGPLTVFPACCTTYVGSYTVELVAVLRSGGENQEAGAVEKPTNLTALFLWRRWRRLAVNRRQGVRINQGNFTACVRCFQHCRLIDNAKLVLVVRRRPLARGACAGASAAGQVETDIATWSTQLIVSLLRDAGAAPTRSTPLSQTGSRHDS